MKTVLCVAGTDPSSAAGLTADVQVVRDYGMHPAIVVTSVVAQNTCGVRSAAAVPDEIVHEQLCAVLDDFDVAATKVGLVPSASAAAIVARYLGTVSVWDPVLRSGDDRSALFHADAAELWAAMAGASVVTPNIPEAAALSARPITTMEDALQVARDLATQGPAVLVKVGHLCGTGPMQDAFAPDGTTSFNLAPLTRVVDDVRGTGCHLSTAIACELAVGASVVDAVEGARRYLNERLRCSAVALGRGRRLIVHGSNS